MTWSQSHELTHSKYSWFTASLIYCHSSTKILLKQGYANHHKKFKQCHGVIINMRRKQLTRAVPAIRGAICFVDRVDDAIVFNSITEVCISFDDDRLRAELSSYRRHWRKDRRVRGRTRQLAWSLRNSHVVWALGRLQSSAKQGPSNWRSNLDDLDHEG